MSVRVLLVLLCIAIIAVPAAASPVVETTQAPLAVYDITPPEGIAGSNGTYHITGNGFFSGLVLSLRLNSGYGPFDATDMTVVNPGHIQCTFDIPPRAECGLYTLIVLYPSGGPGYFAVKQSAFTVRAPTSVTTLPNGAGAPADTDGDWLYDDVNGNGSKDWADVVLFFNQMGWISANEPVSAFDYNRNGRIDFADVVWLFYHL